MSEATERPAGVPIVLISPAMAIGSRYYRPLVEEFEKRGWEARALGRRGFELGQPRAGRENDWTYQDEIGDIEAAVNTARVENPSRPVLLLGHSLGGQLVAGHQATYAPVDGVVTVGGAIPHYRHFAYRGLPLAVMATLIVPATTSLFGYLPKPAFGGPGARTFMRDWAKMVLSGRMPFPVGRPIETRALVVSLADDRLSPKPAVDDLADRLFAPQVVDRWHHTADQVSPGGSIDHIGWVRTPQAIVERVVSWWGIERPR